MPTMSLGTDVQFYCLAPIGGIVGGMAGLVMMFVSHLVISLVNAPVVYLGLVQAACISKKLGPVAKFFSILILAVVVIASIPVLALYGAIAGLCWGTLSGVSMCGPAEMRAGGDPCENLESLNKAFVTFADGIKANIRDLQEKARTEELGAGEKPFEVNVFRAIVSLATALVLAGAGAVAYFFVGLWYYPRMVVATARWLLSSGSNPEGPPACHPVRILVEVMLPVLCLLILLLYPFVGFLVSLFATGATGYTELTLPQVLEKIDPPKEKKKQRSKWWPSQWSAFKKVEKTEPLLPPEPEESKRSCGYHVCHFIGFTGMPWALTGFKDCVGHWVTFNQHMAEYGLSRIVAELSACCDCCMNACKCAETCCCCGCCGYCRWTSAREREHDTAWPEHDVEYGGQDALGGASGIPGPVEKVLQVTMD